MIKTSFTCGFPPCFKYDYQKKNKITNSSYIPVRAALNNTFYHSNTLSL